MTPEELKALIASDPEAIHLFGKADDRGCAARCRAIAPPVIVPAYLTELAIIGLYDNPADAEAIMQRIEGVAGANPLVKRVAAWTKPGAPGINFGDLRVRALMTLPAEQGGLGLTPAQAAPILQAAERPADITEQMVEKLRTGT